MNRSVMTANNWPNGDSKMSTFMLSRLSTAAMFRALMVFPLDARKNWYLLRGANQSESGSAPLVNIFSASATRSAVSTTPEAEAEVKMAPLPKVPRNPDILGGVLAVMPEADWAEATPMVQKRDSIFRAMSLN